MAKVILTAMLTVSVCCLAQQTRREVVHHAANPADDARPNSPNVHDALTFTLVPAMLVLVALNAAWIPARRAASINPTQALRME